MRSNIDHVIEPDRLFHEYNDTGVLIPFSLNNKHYLKSHLTINLDLP